MCIRDSDNMGENMTFKKPLRRSTSGRYLYRDFEMIGELLCEKPHECFIIHKIPFDDLKTAAYI